MVCKYGPKVKKILNVYFIICNTSSDETVFIPLYYHRSNYEPNLFAFFFFANYHPLASPSHTTKALLDSLPQMAVTLLVINRIFIFFAFAYFLFSEM